MSTRVALGLVTAALTIVAAACGGTTPESSSTPEASTNEPAADASHAEHTTASRVYFVEPKDGATIKTLATLQFGSDQYSIAAVPPGEVTEVRPGTGHYHLGIDTECLPAGTVIPKADPWIHFGDGKSTIQQQLTPGSHKLTVQAGDDQHRTVEGLCETISVNVVE